MNVFLNWEEQKRHGPEIEREKERERERERGRETERVFVQNF